MSNIEENNNNNNFGKKFQRYYSHINNELKKAEDNLNEAKKTSKTIEKISKKTEEIDLMNYVAKQYHRAGIYYEGVLRYYTYLNKEVKFFLKSKINFDEISSKIPISVLESARWYTKSAEKIEALVELHKKNDINKKNYRIILPEVYGQAIHKYLHLIDILSEEKKPYFLHTKHPDYNWIDLIDIINGLYERAKYSFVSLANYFLFIKDEDWKIATAYCNAGDCSFSIYFLKKKIGDIDENLKNFQRDALYFYKKSANFIENEQKKDVEWIRIEWKFARNEISNFFKIEDGVSVGNFSERVAFMEKKLGIKTW